MNNVRSLKSSENESTSAIFDVFENKFEQSIIHQQAARRGNGNDKLCDDRRK